MRKLLASVLVIAACAFVASAATGRKTRDVEGNCGSWGADNCKYYFEEASHILTLKGEGQMFDYYPPWDDIYEDIHIVVIEEGITNIGTYSFRQLPNLYSVSIPSTVEYINEKAFEGCRNLASIFIPSKVSWIAGDAFSGCSNMSSLRVEEGNTKYVSDDDILYERWDDGLHLAFCPLAKAGNVTIRGDVVAMENGAFKGCAGLTSVSIPLGITAISANAFEGCSNLTSVDMPYGVKEICTLAFSGCTNLVSVSIPETVTSIGPGAFHYCYNLDQIKLPSQLAEIGVRAFSYTNLTSISIPAATTYIGDNAFEGCNYLDSIEVDEKNTAFRSVKGILYDFDVTRLIRYPTGKIGEYEIPETVKSFDYGSFGNCVGLTSVTIPSSVSSIPLSTFGDCINLVSVTIPETVTSIGENAFYGCSSLTNVKIPSGVTRIETSTFAKCHSLPSINIPSGVSYIGRGAFEDCSSLTKVTIPSGVTEIGDDAFYHCGKLESIHVESGNPSFSSSEDGVLFNLGKTELLQYPGGKKGGYSVPASVQDIKHDAFRGCSGLESVVLPNSITTLPDSFFAECSSLSSVTLPSALTEIGQFVFEGCDSLTSITIPGLVSSLKPNAFSRAKNFNEFIVDAENKHYKAEGGVLYDFEGKHLMLYPRGKASNYEIPEGVEFIDDEAFSECSGLESITIPPSVTSIGTWAFLKCTGLASINGGSGVTEIGVGAFSECSSLTMLTIPPSVTTIKSCAFSECDNLLHVIIPSSVTLIDSSAFRDCCKLISVIYEGKKDPLVRVVENEEDYHPPFRGCTSLEFICLPEDYESSLFCERSSICKSGQCMELRSHINQCYHVTTDAVVEMRPNASRWERQTDGCFEYHCYNDTGRHSWSLCNSTNEADMVCTGEEKCKAGDDASLGKEGYPVSIVVSAINTNDFNMSHVVEVISGVTNAAGVKVASGANKQGKVFRIVAIFDNQRNAEELEGTATDCANLHFGSDESESNDTECVGILRQITSVRRLPKTIVASTSAGSVSSVSRATGGSVASHNTGSVSASSRNTGSVSSTTPTLSNVGDVTIQLFSTEGASNVHGKALGIVVLMLVAVFVFMHNDH